MIAVLDACVIYPPSLRDVLMWLAVVKVYEPCWTEAIHDEWMRSVLADRPEVNAEQLERTRRLMDQTSPKCLVQNYERHIPALALPDENDRHVLAAAIEANASVIVTCNLKDFPRRVLSDFGVHALSPDAFMEALFIQNRPRFLRGIRRHRASLKNPHKTADEYLSTLRTQGLIQIADHLDPYQEEI